MARVGKLAPLSLAEFGAASRPDRSYIHSRFWSSLDSDVCRKSEIGIQERNDPSRAENVP